MTHLVIDDALKVTTVINNLRGPTHQHLLVQVGPRHTWPEVRQMVDSLFANSYVRLPGQIIGHTDQELQPTTKAKRQEQRKGPHRELRPQQQQGQEQPEGR